MLKKVYNCSLLLIASPILLVVGYLFAALIGALIPASGKSLDSSAKMLAEPIYLTSNLLHTDIAVPVNSITKQQFQFLRDAAVPLDNPELKYLIFGWGSRKFYTSTAQYSDIEFSTAWQAATGDASVMHVGLSGDLAAIEGVRSVEMNEENFKNLLNFILLGFSKHSGEPILLEATFGYGDVFYESPDRFNILVPCNTWVSAALRAAGFGTGIWTPTSYSLRLAHWLHN